MTRFEKASVWVTSLLVGITGIVYGWMKYLTVSNDPFSVINHPLQPLFLKLHILVAPLFLLAIGMIAVRHIWRHFRSRTRRSRRSGITAALSLVPMVGTGYLIQVVTGESLLLAMVIAHVALGLLYLFAIGLHQWIIGRSSPNRESGRRRTSRREALEEPRAPGPGNPPRKREPRRASREAMGDVRV